MQALRARLKWASRARHTFPSKTKGNPMPSSLLSLKNIWTLNRVSLPPSW